MMVIDALEFINMLEIVLDYLYKLLNGSKLILLLVLKHVDHLSLVHDHAKRFLMLSNICKRFLVLSLRKKKFIVELHKVLRHTRLHIIFVNCLPLLLYEGDS